MKTSQKVRCSPDANLRKGQRFGLEVSSLVGCYGSSVLGLTEPWPAPPRDLSQGLLCLRQIANKGDPAFHFPVDWRSSLT